MSDCSRIISEPQFLSEKEINSYWARFDLSDTSEEIQDRYLRIEARGKPCMVGFDVGEENNCPLCNLKDPHENIEEFVSIADIVSRFRLAQNEDSED